MEQRDAFAQEDWGPRGGAYDPKILHQIWGFRSSLEHPPFEH